MYKQELTCSVCFKGWAAKVKAAKANDAEPDETQGPSCWRGPCRNATAHIEGIDDWVQLVFWLHGSTIVQNCGIGRDLLAAADALDPQTLEMIVRLSSEIDSLIAAKNKQERDMAKPI